MALIENPFILIEDSYECNGKGSATENNLGLSGLIRNNLFSTNPDFYDPNNQGTLVEYLIQFSSNPCTIVSLSGLEGYTTEPLDTSRFEVALGDEAYYLSGTLTQKISYFDTRYNHEPALLYDTNFYKTDLASLYFNATDEERNQLNEATYLITRYDSATDLTQLLFVSDGTKMTMTQDVFLREIKRALIPEFYDESNSQPQFSGWGGLFTDRQSINTQAFTYEYNPENIFATFKQHTYIQNQYHLFVLGGTDDWFDEPNEGFTGSDYFEAFTAAPKVYFSEDPNHVYTHFDENNNPIGTVSEFLILDFEDLINLEVTKNDFRTVNTIYNPHPTNASVNPAYFIFMYDVYNKPIAILNTTNLATKQVATTGVDAFKYEAEISPTDHETLGNIDIKMHLHWTNLIII